jgi:hypothetical protein
MVLLAVAPVLCHTYRHFRAALLTEMESSVEGYTRAIAYDPGNAEFWWIRGRLRHYALDKNNLPSAIRDYEHALSLNPRLGQAWMDLADCLQSVDDLSRVEQSLRKAMEVWAHSPIIQWQAGNFFLLRGNLEEMYTCFRNAIDYDVSKLDIALQVTLRADSDRPRAFFKLVPDKMTTNLRSLDFFVAHGELDLAKLAWTRFLKNPFPKGFSAGVSAAFPLIDALLERNRVEEAFQTWTESLGKNAICCAALRPIPRIASASSTDPAVNLVWNGSFEDDILDGGFGWRRRQTDEATMRIDRTEHRDGRKSLLLIFNNVNNEFSHLSQILPAPAAGNYWLKYHLKTEGLTTDQKPYLIIEGYPDPLGTILRTDSFPGTSSWREYSFFFKVNPGIKALKLSLHRSRSARFDSRIQGSLWLDSVAVHLDRLQSGTAKKTDEDPLGE